MYPEEAIAPWRKEMIDMGFTETRLPEEVSAAILDRSECTLVVINSVCGSAGGITRPALKTALKNKLRPGKLITAFGGNDIEAVDRMRSHIEGYAPSSPFVALFRKGEQVHAIPRPIFKTLELHHVEKILISIFDRYCGDEVDESVKIYEPADDDFVESTCKS